MNELLCECDYTHSILLSFGILFYRQSYLLALLLPNGVVSLTFAILCFINNTSTTIDFSVRLCRFESFMMIWHLTLTCWLFAVVGYELHFMLCSSLRCLRYLPPTRRRATRNAVLVYIWGAAVAAWSSLGQQANVPMEPTMQNNVFCIPVNHDRKALLFLWLCLIPLSCLVPVSYILWLMWETRRSNLLPRKGQRRTITVFFFRIAVCYASIVTPCFLVLFFRNTWVTWSAILLGYSQVLVTVILSLQKPDVLLAVLELFSTLGCSSCINKSQTNNNNNNNNKPSEGNKDDAQSHCNRTGSRLSMFSSTFTVSSQMNLPASSRVVRPSITPFSGRISEELYQEQSDIMSDLEGMDGRGSEHPLPQTTATTVILPEDVYEDVPKQSDVHYQFDDELEPDNNPDDVICFHIEEEEDESNLPVCPFDP